MIRVAVTTSIDTWERPAVELRRVDLEPVPLPCIRVEEVPGAGERARLAISEADLVVVTSIRALDLVWGSGVLPDIDFAAVGPATAQGIKRKGGRVVRAGHGGALALVRLIEGDLRGRRVLYLHARGSDPDAISRLAGGAGSVVDVELYQSVPVGPGGDPVEAATFASPSAVAGWLQTRTLDGLILAAIGPATAGELARHGRPPEVTAPNPGFPALADALAAYLEEAA